VFSQILFFNADDSSTYIFYIVFHEQKLQKTKLNNSIKVFQYVIEKVWKIVLENVWEPWSYQNFWGHLQYRYSCPYIGCFKKTMFCFLCIRSNWFIKVVMSQAIMCYILVIFH